MNQWSKLTCPLGKQITISRNTADATDSWGVVRLITMVMFQVFHSVLVLVLCKQCLPSQLHTKSNNLIFGSGFAYCFSIDLHIFITGPPCHLQENAVLWLNDSRLATRSLFQPHSWGAELMTTVYKLRSLLTPIKICIHWESIAVYEQMLYLTD